jgi:uncharacterized protein
MSLADWVDGTKVSIFLTHRCNLRCRYCYNSRQFDRAMSPLTARRAVDFAFAQAQSGFLVLSFFGGEPLLELELIEQTVAYARAESVRRGRTLRFSLPTNGTLLDERRLRLLADHRFRVQVSVDGGEQAQNANRRFANGRTTWPRVSANLVRMVAAGLDLHVVAVVDPGNVRTLAQSFTALRELGVGHIYLAPNLTVAWDEDAWLRLDESLAALAERWCACLRADEKVRLDPFHAKVQAHIGRGLAPPIRCSFGARDFAISPRGRIYPCDRIVKGDDDDTLCLGDLDSGLDEAKRLAIATARKRVEPECVACALRDRCTNGCGCNNYEQTGDPGRVSPALCRWERAVIAAADRAANTLFAERSPAFLRRFYSVSESALVTLKGRKESSPVAAGSSEKSGR